MYALCVIQTNKMCHCCKFSVNQRRLHRCIVAKPLNPSLARIMQLSFMMRWQWIRWWWWWCRCFCRRPHIRSQIQYWHAAQFPISSIYIYLCWQCYYCWPYHIDIHMEVGMNFSLSGCKFIVAPQILLHIRIHKCVRSIQINIFIMLAYVCLVQDGWMKVILICSFENQALSRGFRSLLYPNLYP